MSFKTALCLGWNEVLVGYIVCESFVVTSPTVEELKLFGHPLIPLLQSCAWKAPTSTPPKFANLAPIEIVESREKEEKGLSRVISYADAASAPKTLETLWNFHEWRPLAKGPLPFVKEMKL